MSIAIKQKLREWRHDPLQFVSDCIRIDPSDQQKELLTSIAKSKRVSVRSGHGTGKDACASWIILWFLTTRPYSKVVCTAPTGHQLSDILWSELSKWLAQSNLSSEFALQKDKLYNKNADGGKDRWWALARSTSARASKEEQSETLSGFHGDHLLIVVDEASGVVDPVFIPLEGALTQEDNIVLLIGNMTKSTGYFYDSHFHSSISKRWTKLHWDSRHISKQPLLWELERMEYVSYMAEKYGIESNVFRIRVTGDPPSDAETNLIPLAWAMQCVGNEIEPPTEEPLYFGVDVARYGEDNSVILPRQGLKIFPWYEFYGLNTISLGDQVVARFAEMMADGVAIDEIGVGAGVVDWVRRKPMMDRLCFGINVGMASSDKTKYHRLRDELWWLVRERCMKMQYSFPDQVILKGKMEINIGHELANELSQPTYEFDDNGAMKVESKKQMKLRGVDSPNIADALCLSEYFSSSAYNIWGDRVKQQLAKIEKRKRDRRIYGPGYDSNQGPHAWMTV